MDYRHQWTQHLLIMNNKHIPMLAHEHYPPSRIMQEDQGKDGETNNHENGRSPEGFYPAADDI